VARALGLGVLLYLALLTAGGLEVGASAARGPEHTLAAELVVDGARVAEEPRPLRRQARRSGTRRTRLPDGLSLHVARTAEEIEALRPTWAALQGPQLTSDLDYFLTLIRHDSAVLRPHVVVVEQAGAATGLVVARLEDARLRARLGYGVTYAPRLRMLTVAYGGLLGDCGPALAFPDVLRESLAGERVDVVRLRMLPVGSSLHAAASAAAPPLQRRRLAPAALHWHCSIPDSFEEFLAARSKERRRHVRRYQRRLEEAHEQQVEVRLFTSRAELDQLFAETDAVHRTTYQAALGVGFSDDELCRSLTELGMDRGWFRGAILYLGGRPAAFWHGNAYRGTFATSATGFDPAESASRPGTYLLMRLVEDLCADPTVDTLDFGFGDAEYKRHFGDSNALEEDVVVFEPRARALAVNAGQTAVLATAAAGRWALARSGHLRSARKAWRERLSPSQDA
jgi:CelD/BcsL family acetyltransferase involved in cellulose biosynthesis